ncbi:MAG: alpha/beta hydrolase family protein [Vitreoscilla sp.]
MTWLARCAAGAGLAIGLGLGPIHAAETPPGPPSSVPTAAFFGFDDLSGPVISPDGDALAMLVRNKEGRRQLAILQTADLSKASVIASFNDADVSRVHWVNSKRLVFSIFHENEAYFDQTGGALYAVDRNGDNMRTLIRPSWQREQQTGKLVTDRALDPDTEFERTLSDGSDDVVVRRWTYVHTTGEVNGSIPSRLNTRNGSVHSLVEGNLPEFTYDWFVGPAGELLGGIASKEGTSTVLTRTGTEWKEVHHFPSYAASADSLDFQQVGADGAVYVSRAYGPDSTSALFKLDPASGQATGEPLVRIKGFDFTGTLVYDDLHRKLLGAHYDADADGTAWFDPAMAALQKEVDARLPGTINRIDPASCGCANRVLVSSHSDHQPAIYYLCDRKATLLIPIGNSRPAIDARQMADTDFYRIKSRDGQDIPVYVTKPKGKGPFPTVVLVHGGPFLRGWNWEWDDESQFLASRGYLVVKPEYRGSKGYGSALFLSGFKQWGLKMQDDIADATRWAADKGLADARRTCIAGASYGGYATLMGLVRYGDLYQCGVAWAAVSDIALMHDTHWSDMSEEWRSYGMPVMVGDPAKDAEQLAQTSPLQQAERITRPLLLAHGGADRRVTLEHATRLRRVLQARKAPVTWIEYREEGHGWYLPANRIDFYDRMVKFLDASIGPGK